jgi:hypothetical protein
MSSLSTQSVVFWLRLVTLLQAALMLAACAWAARKGRGTYTALSGYLLVNAAVGLLASALLAYPALLVGREATVYAALFWTAYGASGVLTFMTAQQIFRDALAPVPGLRRLALLAYRWVAVVSIAVSVIPAVLPLFFHAQTLHIMLLQGMRCVSVMEFFLLAFILLSSHTLGISLRSRVVGITLGFGVLAAVDTLCFMVLLYTDSPMLPWILARQTGSLLAVSLWLVYLIKPEPNRLLITLPMGSQLRKWNEIATALGKPVPNVALTPQQGAFFLQDVEKVVDRVLSRNAGPPPAP